jgi:hypothetical protein
MSKRLRWARHVVRVGERIGAYKVWWGNLREGGHLDDADVDGRIILKWISEHWDWGGGMD